MGNCTSESNKNKERNKFSTQKGNNEQVYDKCINKREEVKEECIANPKMNNEYNNVDTNDIKVEIEETPKIKKNIYLICPSCGGGCISIIKIMYNSSYGNYVINYKCSCDITKEKQDLLTKCLSDKKGNNICSIHNTEKIKFHCEQCQLNICEKCKFITHNSHNCLEYYGYIQNNVLPEYKKNNFSNYSLIQEKEKEFNTIINQKRNQFNNKIEQIISYYTKIKNSINEEINTFCIKQNEFFTSLLNLYSQNLENLNSNNNLEIQDIESISFLGKKNLSPEDFEFQTNLDVLSNNNEKINNLDKIPKLEFQYNISLTDKNEYSLEKTIKGHTDKVISIIQLHDNTIASGSYDKTICFWDINTFTEIKNKKIKDNGYILALLEIEDNVILSGTSNNTITAWNILTSTSIYIFKGHDLWVNSIILIKPGLFASCSNDYTIRTWDYTNTKSLTVLNGHTDCILALIRLINGNLCSGAADNTIKIWDWKKEECLFTLTGHTKWIKCLTQLSNGDIVSGSDDKLIKIWRNNQCIKTLQDHSDSVRTLCQINKKLFASGSFDNSIIIWESNKYKQIQQLEGHTQNVISIIPLSDGKIASCSNDTTIKIWS